VGAPRDNGRLLLAFRGPIPTDRIAGDWQALAAIIVHSRDYKEQQQQCALLLFVCLLYFNTGSSKVLIGV
jgi:hypothetical protein